MSEVFTAANFTEVMCNGMIAQLSGGENEACYMQPCKSLHYGYGSQPTT